MGIHPYCIVPAGHAVPGSLSGVGGAPVLVVEIGSLGVWVSPTAEAPEPDLETLRAHDAVGRAGVTERVTPLPVRFGGWVAEAEALTPTIQAREAELLDALARFAGTFEVGVRILEAAREDRTREDDGPGGAPVPAHGGPGRTYLESARRTRTRERARRMMRDAAVNQLRNAVGALAGDERCMPLSDPPGLVSVAHLVQQTDVAAWRDGVEGFGASRPDLQVFVVGPWLPYSFAP